MGTWIRRIIFLGMVGAAVWWFRQHTEGHTPVSGPSLPEGKPSAAFGCVAAADRANSALADASKVGLRPPVDQNAWASEEGRTNSAISTAESECMGASSDTDRHAVEEARAALSLMRQSLADLSSS